MTNFFVEVHNWQQTKKILLACLMIFVLTCHAIKIGAAGSSGETISFSGVSRTSPKGVLLSVDRARRQAGKWVESGYTYCPPKMENNCQTGVHWFVIIIGLS